jgi:hypothetical protein
MSDYDCSESFTVLVVIGLIILSPVILLFFAFVFPAIEAAFNAMGW